MCPRTIAGWRSHALRGTLVQVPLGSPTSVQAPGPNRATRWLATVGSKQPALVQKPASGCEQHALALAVGILRTRTEFGGIKFPVGILKAENKLMGCLLCAHCTPAAGHPMRVTSPFNIHRGAPKVYPPESNIQKGASTRWPYSACSRPLPTLRLDVRSLGDTSVETKKQKE